MAIDGELAGIYGARCSCGAVLRLAVCVSNAGYYLGYSCLMCGPRSRETVYYRTRKEAEGELSRLKAGLNIDGLRNTFYSGGG